MFSAKQGKRSYLKLQTRQHLAFYNYNVDLLKEVDGYRVIFSKLQGSWEIELPHITLFCASVPFGLHLAKWDEVVWGEKELKCLLHAAVLSTSAPFFVYILHVSLQQIQPALVAFKDAGYRTVHPFYQYTPGTALGGVAGMLNNAVNYVI